MSVTSNHDASRKYCHFPLIDRSASCLGIMTMSETQYVLTIRSKMHGVSEVSVYIIRDSGSSTRKSNKLYSMRIAFLVFQTE